MKYIKIIGLSLLSFSSVSYAGFEAFTMHSRANCVGFNESVSWHWNHPRDLITWTTHQNSKATYSCEFNSGGWSRTWRAAALHFSEGYGGWYVRGFHWGLNRNLDPVKLADTEAVDCNIYDGWWDV